MKLAAGRRPATRWWREGPTHLQLRGPAWLHSVYFSNLRRQVRREMAATLNAASMTQQEAQQQEQHQQQQQPVGAQDKVAVCYSINYCAAYGQHLAVTGNCAELGCWDTHKALRLAWQAGNNWQALLELQIPKQSGNIELRYKYLVMNSDGSVELWQQGPDISLILSTHSMQLPESHQQQQQQQWFVQQLEVVDSWDQPQSTHHRLAVQLPQPQQQQQQQQPQERLCVPFDAAGNGRSSSSSLGSPARTTSGGPPGSWVDIVTSLGKAAVGAAAVAVTVGGQVAAIAAEAAAEAVAATGTARSCSKSASHSSVAAGSYILAGLLKQGSSAQATVVALLVDAFKQQDISDGSSSSSSNAEASAPAATITISNRGGTPASIKSESARGSPPPGNSSRDGSSTIPPSIAANAASAACSAVEVAYRRAGAAVLKGWWGLLAATAEALSSSSSSSSGGGSGSRSSSGGVDGSSSDRSQAAASSAYCSGAAGIEVTASDALQAAIASAAEMAGAAAMGAASAITTAATVPPADKAPAGYDEHTTAAPTLAAMAAEGADVLKAEQQALVLTQAAAAEVAVEAGFAPQAAPTEGAEAGERAAAAAPTGVLVITAAVDTAVSPCTEQAHQQDQLHSEPEVPVLHAASVPAAEKTSSMAYSHDKKGVSQAQQGLVQPLASEAADDIALRHHDGEERADMTQPASYNDPTGVPLLEARGLPQQTLIDVKQQLQQQPGVAPDVPASASYDSWQQQALAAEAAQLHRQQLLQAACAAQQEQELDLAPAAYGLRQQRQGLAGVLEALELSSRLRLQSQDPGDPFLLAADRRLAAAADVFRSVTQAHTGGQGMEQEQQEQVLQEVHVC